MDTRENAKAFLLELHSSMPRSFYDKVVVTQRGIGFVLDYLEQADGEVIAGDLAKKMDVSTARVAALLRGMERSGFIMRRTSDRDARQTVVEITPAGIARVKEMREQMLDRIRVLLAQVSKEDLDTFIRISHKIKEVMEE